MQPLFSNDKAYAYLLIATLLMSSLYFATSPTGLVTGARSIADVAFSSENVRAFIESNIDFTVITQELDGEKLESLQQDYPHIYSNLPDEKIYQMIFDAGDRALIVLLSEERVFGTWEVELTTK